MIGMTTSEKISLALAIVSFLTLVEIWRERKATHERARKLATLEFVRVVSVSTQEIRSAFGDKFTSAGIASDEDLTRFLSEENKELRASVRELLNDFENLATGCEQKIYDWRTVDRQINTIIRNWWNRTERYVRHQRTDGNRAFEGFERLARKMRKRYEKRNPAGKRARSLNL